MMHFIGLMFLVWVIFMYPSIVIGIFAAVVIVYYVPGARQFLKDIRNPKSETTEEPKKRKGDIKDYINDNGVINWTQYYKDRLMARIRPGAEDDPIIKEHRESIKKHMDEQKRRNKEEEIKDFNEEAKNFWAKRR